MTSPSESLFSALGRQRVVFGDDPHGLEDLEMLGGVHESAAVSFNASVATRANIAAALVARQLRLKSVDYTRRRYEAFWELEPIRDPRTEFAIEITAEAKRWVKAAVSRGVLIEGKPDHLGMFASGAALYRSVITFRTATLTIRNGFHFETAVLLRLIVEQLAWIAAVHRLTDDSLFALQPQSCIGALRRYFPNAGQLYGHLSELAHITPEMTLRYLDLKDSENPGATAASPRFSHIDGFCSLYLADMLVVMAELVWADVLPSLHATYRDASGELAPSPERVTLTKLEQWRERMSVVENMVSAA